MEQFDSILIDRKIDGINASITMKIGDYSQLAKKIIKKNDYQRGKVRLTYRIYSLLKQDLIDGCLMPPIILATTEKFNDSIQDELKDMLEYDELILDDKNLFMKYITEAMQSNEILILDGLQRTTTINDVIDESKNKWWEEKLQNHPIRIEIYLGLNKQGILYRMLTLNTGITPMTFRHQLEILYHDHLALEFGEGIKIIREISDEKITSLGLYRFGEVIELYHSFLSGNPRPVDKRDLLEEIQSLDFLEKFGSRGDERMSELLKIYHRFALNFEKKIPAWSYDGDEEITRPYGKSIVSVFSRSQTMTGFGACLSELIENKQFGSFNDFNRFIEKKFKPRKLEMHDGLNRLMEVLDDLRKNTKRYGEAQRGIFNLFFKVLFTQSDPNQISKAADEAYQRYRVVYG